MARLPDAYSSQRDTPRAARPLANIGDGGGAALRTFGSDVAQGGAGFGAIADREQEKDDQFQYAYAKSTFLREKAKADNAFDDDPDYSSWGERYKKKLEEARATAASFIKSPKDRQLFEATIGATEEQGLQSILDKARGKEKDTGRAATLEVMEANRQAALSAPDEATRAEFLRTTHDLIAGGQRKGWWTAEEAVKKRQEFAQNYAEDTYWRLPREERLKLLGASPTTTGAGLPAEAAGDATQAALHLISAKEGGYSQKAFWDKNAFRAGFSSDTVTDAQGNVRRVKEGDVVSREDAERDFQRRVGGSFGEIAETIGQDRFRSLGPQQQAVLASLHYNYGKLPSGVANALKNGEPPEAVAAAIGGLSDNKDRRKEEAAIYLGKQPVPVGRDVPGGTMPGSRLVAGGRPDFTKPTGTPLDILPVERRAKLYETDLRQLELEDKRRLAAEEKAERLADKRLREFGDEVAKEGYTLHADGKLTRQWVDNARRFVSPSEHKGMLELLKPENEYQDDPAVISSVVRRLDKEDLVDDLTGFLKEKRLKQSTYTSLVTQNRGYMKDDKPASPYILERRTLEKSLDPGALSGIGEVPARAAQSNALLEYDDFVRANPAATAKELRATREEINGRYSLIKANDMAMSAGVPRFVSKPRFEITATDLQAARAETMRRLDANEIPREIARRNLEVIEVWERAPDVIARSKPKAEKK